MPYINQKGKEAFIKLAESKDRNSKLYLGFILSRC